MVCLRCKSDYYLVYVGPNDYPVHKWVCPNCGWAEGEEVKRDEDTKAEYLM